MAVKKVKLTEEGLKAKDIKGTPTDVLVRATKVKMPTKTQMHTTYMALRRVLRAVRILQKTTKEEPYAVLKDTDTLKKAREYVNPAYQNALSTDIKRVEKEVADVMHRCYYGGNE
jgi:hypothetical protein